MEERRRFQFVSRQDSRVQDERQQRPKRWLAHSGHPREEDRKAPHIRIDRGPNR